jgi:hypothetical protein
MIIVFLSNGNSEAAKRLLGHIQKEFCSHQIETATTIKALWERFHHPITERTILILVPENIRQLEELGNMGDLFNDRPILLVLPDRKPLTVSTGHKLYPRFMSYADSDASCIAAVLSRMIEKR